MHKAGARKRCLISALFCGFLASSYSAAAEGLVSFSGEFSGGGITKKSKDYKAFVGQLKSREYAATDLGLGAGAAVVFLNTLGIDADAFLMGGTQRYGWGPLARVTVGSMLLEGRWSIGTLQIPFDDPAGQPQLVNIKVKYWSIFAGYRTGWVTSVGLKFSRVEIAESKVANVYPVSSSGYYDLIMFALIATF